MKIIKHMSNNILEKSKENVGAFYLHKSMLSYLKKYWKLSLPMSLLTIIMIGYTAIIPLITKTIFDSALADKNFHLFITLIYILILGLFFLVALWVITDIMQSVIGVKIANDIRYSVFKKIHEISHANYRINKPGDLLSRYENCIMISYVLSQIFWGVLGNILFVILAGIIMLYLNWQLSILVFVIAPLTLFLSHEITHKAEEQFKIKKNDELKIFHMTREEIDLHDIIPVLQISKFRLQQYKNVLEKFEKKDFKFNLYLLFTNTMIATGIVVLQLLIVALGSYWVFTGHLTIGSFVAFLTMYATFSYEMNALGTAYPALISASRGWKIIEELLVFPVNEAKQHMPDLNRLKKNIQFKNINFEFLEEKRVLHHITMEIKAGESVAILGPSGSGKSTVLDLILRQEVPTSGQIQLDGKNIWEYSEESYFNQISEVPRNPRLFLMSISENIRMGKLDATQDDIVNAAKAAEIHEEIINLPEGYDTLVVWGGANLSSGQMQRIILARALIGNPAILILDEATSALDTHNQEAIMSTLLKQAKRRTTIMVTHHLKEVINFDKIILLDHGRIVETGNHKELLAKKGEYFKLWKKQMGFEINRIEYNIQIKLSSLRNVPIFKNLSNEFLRSCIDKFLIEEVPANNKLFEEGDLANKFYVIVRGKVSILKKIDGQYKEVSILEDGDFFGEIALLHAVPRTACAVTLETCSFLVLYREQFSTLMEQLPLNTRDELNKISEERLRDLND